MASSRASGTSTPTRHCSAPAFDRRRPRTASPGRAVRGSLPRCGSCSKRRSPRAAARFAITWARTAPPAISSSSTSSMAAAAPRAACASDRSASLGSVNGRRFTAHTANRDSKAHCHCAAGHDGARPRRSRVTDDRRVATDQRREPVRRWRQGGPAPVRSTRNAIGRRHDSCFPPSDGGRCASLLPPRRFSRMIPSRDLAARFEAYADWRRRLSAGISSLHEWLSQQDLADAQVDVKVQQLLERLQQDKLVVAFVAEFSRGKSELINAIFFADFGQRLLPSSAGRTTMCPTELLYDASRPPSIRLLPIETRLKSASVAELKSYADEWITLPLDLS